MIWWLFALSAWILAVALIWAFFVGPAAPARRSSECGFGTEGGSDYGEVAFYVAIRAILRPRHRGPA